ncbi:MAG: ankyrin repeat domain-containing protein [Acholeplasmataceae bacterium]|nr:ankyrin repeat domain-containing protein [Acholeplasmataceae bacterium]
MDPFIHARNNNLNFFYQNPIHLDIVDDLGQSLLFYAIRGNALEMAYYLIENHINPNIVSQKGETALFEAIRKGKLNLVVKLIKHYANLNIQNKRGETPLHLACQKGNLDMIMLLVENGANLYLTNELGQSILYYALKSQNIGCFDYVRMLSPKIKKNDKNGNTLLHLAAELGNYQLTKHLLELSENPHFKNNFKETPIFEAIKKNNKDLIILFVKYGSYLDTKNKYGQTLLDISGLNSDNDISQLVEDYLSSSLIKNNIEKNPLRYGVIKADLDYVRNILYKGIADKKDEYLLYAYDYAKRNKEKDIISLLDDNH